MSENKKPELNVEDAKKKAKGILGYFKHLVKDPVKTVPEAKARWKEIGIFAASSLALTVVSGVLIAIVDKISKGEENIITKIVGIPSIIGGAGILFSLFLALVLLKITSVLKRRECKNCKEQITYGDNVKYEVLREWVKKEVSTNNNGSTHVRQTDMAEVQIDCVCQKCGTPKQIKLEFRLAGYYDGSLKYSYKVEDLVKGFFTGEHIQ